ncbi:hypothetical protein GURASL_31130 [Geotalea uraniireducens]|uniref:Uncharacterized protein n=1 Tax=Geotalea uraniireducens TaxID=351604 RepID=A0ABM8EP12_9BACT|nr:hypothetical protein [Geotalea uraniireducens]BDV44190.1 hypothetical protein GURASL_31130 [Geotalea uraniireducens]
MESIRDRFIGDLLSKPPDKIASFWMLERIPHAFNNNLELYINWKHVLADKISVDSASIFLIGSGSAGVSMNPYKNYKEFDAESDLGVAIVSDYYFNESWRYMRGLGAELHKLPPRAKQSVIDHQKNYIYWGTIATDKILAYLPFGKKWGTALKEMSVIEPSGERTINARIYKDFESLRSYHVLNINNLREHELGKGV